MRGAAARRAGRAGRRAPGRAGAGAGGPPEGAFGAGAERGEARRLLFNEISPVYDGLNDLLSLGQHRVWKRMAVRLSGAAEGDAVLDVCCGSGDLARLLARQVGPAGRVTGLDFAADMLEDAAGRDVVRPWRAAEVAWVLGDAQALPFPDESFDAATMGYGLRNVADPLAALRELCRVTRPGAKCAVLDFNNSPDPAVRAVQGFFLDNLVVPVARGLGVAAEYEYLKPSIAEFATGPEQERLARRAGFRTAKHYGIAGGLMGLLVVGK